MLSRSSGPSLHAQPAPCEYCVSRAASEEGVFMVRASYRGRTASANDGEWRYLSTELRPRAENFGANFFEIQTNLFGDNGRAGESGDIFEHSFASVTKTR